MSGRSLSWRLAKWASWFREGPALVAGLGAATIYYIVTYDPMNEIDTVAEFIHCLGGLEALL